MKTFKTIDLCVEYLTSILGCKWDSEKESKLVKNCYFKFKGVYVMYDPYGILD